MRIYLETPRLIFREFTSEDLQGLIDLNSDAEVMQHITAGAPIPSDRICHEVLPRFLRLHRESSEFGYWAAVEKNKGDFLGWFQFKRKDEDSVELGYRLKRSAWGRGFATEGARALLVKGFEQLGVERVFARAMISNQASIRVMEKVGLKFEGNYIESEFPSNHQTAVIYSLTSATYRFHQSRPSPATSPADQSSNV